MSPKRAHYVNLVCEALKSFNVNGLAKTPAIQRKFISTNAVETAEVAEDVTSSFDFGACRSFFDYITARTKVAARVEWIDYVETVEPAGEIEMVRSDAVHGEPRMIVPSVRERAIAEWRKLYDPRDKQSSGWPVRVAKSRSRKTITVTRDVPWATGATMTFSYEGGNLRVI